MNNFYPGPQQVMFNQGTPGLDFFRPGSAVVTNSRAQKQRVKQHVSAGLREHSVELPSFGRKGRRVRKGELQDDLISLKKVRNSMADENTRLRTAVQKLTAELAKKERLVDDLLSGDKHTSPGLGKLKAETHLTGSLK
jgi:hypothetical protein